AGGLLKIRHLLFSLMAMDGLRAGLPGNDSHILIKMLLDYSLSAFSWSSSSLE
ncbi:hypothetical protein S1OALGB6SA_1216, partial [Olavius algarvensis spirochete endosymbiont]